MLNITDNYQEKNTNKWGDELQQKLSRLRPYVTTSSGLTGKVIFWDDFGILDFDEKTSRMAKTELDEVPTDKRCMRPRLFTKSYGFDEFDQNQLADLDLPVGKTIDGLKAAAERRMDDVMINGFLGTNYKGVDGVVPVEIDESQKVKVNYIETGSATNSNLTVAKLRRVVQTFQENECWKNDDSLSAGDQIVMAVTSSQIMALLREKEVSSYDFNNIKALVHGEVDEFMGIKFIRTQRLPKIGSERSCLAWVKSKAWFGLWNDFKVKVSIRDDMDEALQIRAKFACGATRLDERAFIPVLCDETK